MFIVSDRLWGRCWCRHHWFYSDLAVGQVDKEQEWTRSYCTICQTCMMLSSETEQITHGSTGFQEKSEILAVWPP